MNWVPLLRAVRQNAGLTQAELARQVGTSRTRLSAYESGRVVPSVELFERLLAAAGGQLVVERAAPLTRAEEKSLGLHRAIAARLVASPEAVLAKARANLAIMRAADSGGRAGPWLDEWERQLGGSLLDLVGLLLSRSQRACDLRQSTPFAGVLSPPERLAGLRGDAVAS